MTYTCKQCGMAFQVGPPPSSRAETGFCGEPTCRRHHWSAQGSDSKTVSVGIYPADLPSDETENQKAFIYE